MERDKDAKWYHIKGLTDKQMHFYGFFKSRYNKPYRYLIWN